MASDAEHDLAPRRCSLETINPGRGFDEVAIDDEASTMSTAATTTDSAVSASPVDEDQGLDATATDDPVDDVTEDLDTPVEVHPLARARFVDGRLELGDPNLVKGLRRTNLSPSASTTLHSCPARYAADRLLRDVPSAMSAMELGTSAHSVLEHFYGLAHDQRTPEAISNIINKLLVGELAGAMLPPEAADLADDPDDEAAYEAVNAWIEAVAERSLGIFDIEDPTKVVPRSLEWKLTGVEVAGVPFVGVLDRADMVGDETSVATGVVDYKTGRPGYNSPFYNDDHGDQLRLYVMAAEAFDGRRPAWAQVFYTAHGQSRFISLSKAEMAGTVERFTGAWGSIQSATDTDAFECKTSGLCGWCPLVSACPAAAEAGKERSDRFEGPNFHLPVIETPKALGADPDTVLSGGDGDEPVAVDFDNNPWGHTREDYPDPTKDTTMTLYEDKPWEETTGPNNTLNPNAYAATAVFGTASLAVELLDDAGVALKKDTVDAMAQTLARITADVQKELTGSTSFQDGANVRLRGVVRTVVETMPPPLGEGTTEQWAAWTDAATRRARAIALAAIRLYDATITDAPYGPLAIDDNVENLAADDFADAG